MSPARTQAEQAVIRRLQIAQRNSGLSQRNLAKQLGWSPTRLGRLLKGERQVLISDVTRIAAKLNVPWRWFVADIPGDEPSPQLPLLDRFARLLEELEHRERKGASATELEQPVEE